MRSFSLSGNTQAAVFLVLLGMLVYSNTLEVPFYLDDFINIVWEPAIHLKQLSLDSFSKILNESSMLTRPVANFSFALNYYLHDEYVAGYHIVNIAIHLICSIFIYLIFQEVLRINSENSNKSYEPILPLLAATIWLVHPVNTQTVTYIVQRMNGMASMFYLMSFYFYIVGRRTRTLRGRIICFISCFCIWLLALGSKEIAIALPVVVYIFEWIFFQNGSGRWLAKKAPYLALITVFMGMVGFVYASGSFSNFIAMGYHVRDFSLMERLLTELRVVVHYVSLFFYPDVSRLAFEHDFLISRTFWTPPSTLASALLLLFMLYFSIFKAKKYPLVSFSVLWFLFNLILESTIVPLEIIFEHRTYLPYVFVPLPLVAGLFCFGRSNKYLLTAFPLIILTLSVLSYQRNAEWLSPIAFWEKNVLHAPKSSRVHEHYGSALAAENRFDDAIRQYEKAISLNSSNFKAYISNGLAYFNKGDADNALKYLLFAEEKGIGTINGYYVLGAIYGNKKNYPLAKFYLEKSLELSTETSGVHGVHGDLGFVLGELKEYDRALYHLNKAIGLKPEQAVYHSRAGKILLLLDQPRKAVFHFRETLRINPGHPTARKNLTLIFNRYPELR